MRMLGQRPGCLARRNGPLVLAPSFAGCDGISRVAALLRRAFNESRPRSGGIECWQYVARRSALAATTQASATEVRVSRQPFRLALQGTLRPFVRSPPALALCLHLHLAPVLLPCVYLRGTRLVVFLHGVEAWQPLTGVRRLGVAGAWALIANSEFTARGFLSANGAWARALPLKVCPLGLGDHVDAGDHSPEGDYALIVGRLAAGERYKGHDELLDAWPQILARCPGARLLVVGDGDDRPRLEAKAIELGLGRAVRFLGKVSEEALVELYRRARYFVMPSRGEGFGLVYLEAMRAAKACIAGMDGGAEVVRHGETGLVVDPEDRSALVAAVCALESDPHLRLVLGRAGRTRFVTHFTEEKFKERLRAALGLEPREV